MEHKRLCESDYRFLSVVWDNEPLTSARLVELCAQELGWKKSTTYTMIKKLCEKGLLQSEDAVVTALVSRQTVQAEESRRFLDQTFNGSISAFMAAFSAQEALSADEIDELRRYLDGLSK